MANVTPRKPSPEIVKTFWRQICELPRNENPSINNPGEKDQNFNSLIGDPAIFYLSSQREGPGERMSNVPADKEIFTPALGVVATKFESPSSSDTELQALAKTDQDSIAELSVELDGEPVGNLYPGDNYMVTTDKFIVNFPEDPTQAVFQGNCGPTKNSEAFATGRYLIIGKIPKGEVLAIHIKGKLLVNPGVPSLERGFNQDLTYTLKGV
jgi:hypothetical protein